MTTQNLKEAVKALNESGLIEKKIKLVAVKMADVEKNFLEAVNSIPEESEAEIPDMVVEVFNTLVKEKDLPIEEPVPVKSAKKEKVSKPKADKPKKEKKDKGPGVIATIKSQLAKGPITKEKLLNKLVELFPDRPESGMGRTINVQLYRLKASKTDKGYVLK